MFRVEFEAPCPMCGKDVTWIETASRMVDEPTLNQMAVRCDCSEQ